MHKEPYSKGRLKNKPDESQSESQGPARMIAIQFHGLSFRHDEIKMNEH